MRKNERAIQISGIVSAIDSGADVAANDLDYT